MRTRLFPWLILLLAAVVLGGCASFQTRFDYENDLLTKRGQPTRIWKNDDGTRTLEYATQPRGETCWMYTVDANGRIVEQYDALESRNHGRVKVGMTVEEVQRTLGTERSIQRFERMKEEVWDWNVPNPYPGIMATYFNVHFIDGKVDRTSYTYEYYNDPGDFGWFGPGFHYGLGYGYGYRPYPFSYYGYGSPRFGWRGHYGW